MRNIKNFTLLITLLFSTSLIGQVADRFEPEIQKFEAQDLTDGYQKDFVLFTGSSSIRLWNSLESDMKGISVLNRGFGGATLRELNQYWDRIAGKHQPDVVVVYCGENDISEGSSVQQTVDNFKTFLDLYQKTYPSTPLIYIAMKPSLSRWGLWQQYQAADREIALLLSDVANASFVDLSPSMFDKEGSLKQDIFVKDGLHMNEKGYQGWTEQLRPLIESELATDTK